MIPTDPHKMRKLLRAIRDARFRRLLKEGIAQSGKSFFWWAFVWGLPPLDVYDYVYGTDPVPPFFIARVMAWSDSYTKWQKEQ